MYLAFRHLLYQYIPIVCVPYLPVEGHILLFELLQTNDPLKVLPSCAIPASLTLWARHRSGINVYEREDGWETNEDIKLLTWDVSGDSCAGKHEWSSGKVRGWRDKKFDHLGRIAVESRYYKEESYRVIVWILNADGASICDGQSFTNVGLPRTICIWNPHDI